MKNYGIAELFELYKEYRKIGWYMKPGEFKQWLEHREKPKLEFKTNRQGYLCARWEEDGFWLEAHIETDQEGDPSYLGSFVTKWQEGAIALPPYQTKRPCHTPTHFVPEISLEERRKNYHSMGYSKGVAHERASIEVHQDAKRANSYGETWGFMMMIVKAYKSGIALGMSTLGGIEDNESDWTTYARECAAEAIFEAKEKLKQLCCKEAS